MLLEFKSDFTLLKIKSLEQVEVKRKYILYLRLTS